MSEPTDHELVLGYIYRQALDKGDIAEIEATEQLIARDIPSGNPLHTLVLINVGNRMTPDDWQSALGDVCANIIGDSE